MVAFPRPPSRGGGASGLSPHVACPAPHSPQVSASSLHTSLDRCLELAFIRHFLCAELCRKEHLCVEWQRWDLNPGRLALGRSMFDSKSVSPSGPGAGRRQDVPPPLCPLPSRSGGDFRQKPLRHTVSSPALPSPPLDFSPSLPLPRFPHFLKGTGDLPVCFFHKFLLICNYFKTRH